jgi:hypothetical protein
MTDGVTVGNQQQRTESHVQEIRNLHRAVEPSTAWQDGFESHHDLLLNGNSDAAQDVMKQAGKLMSLTRQDLKGWKSRHSDLTSAGELTPATEAP